MNYFQSNKKSFLLTMFITVSLLAINRTYACTNFLITKGASTDGSTMISYSADSHQLYGELYYKPATDHPAGTKVKIYEWDTGKYLCEIDQVTHTYSVAGNMNEFQVAVGETTYGGHKELQDTIAKMDYGNLIYLSLQRAKTAREAIRIISELMDKHGFRSHGESFSISDPNEVWIMEIIGKGSGSNGAVWVARMVPDGYVCAHANQARITTFPFSKKNKWDDPKQTTFHSPDVISFAREKNYFNGKNEDFSFSDTYAPVDFGAARFCEIRVWAFFNEVKKDMSQYWEYAKGHIKYDKKTGYAINRMPLWIKPDKKISVHDMMNFMRDHLEGTELDMRKDIGAGPFECPYRWRPLTWEVDSIRYFHERATASQQTAFSFITQSRSWLPDPIGGINWFGVDDAASSVYIPIYCGITKVPDAYAEGNGNMMEFTFKSAFWVFSLVSNFAYTRYNVIHPEIQEVQSELENKFIEEIKDIDAKAKKLYEKDEKTAINFLTDYSVSKGNETFTRWTVLFQYLFTKYMDGNMKKTKDGKFIDNGTGEVAYPDWPGYGEKWYRKIVKETGDKLKMLEEPGH
ncbi:MAG: C69 family dipeptidase [Bacteroidota bacterium]